MSEPCLTFSQKKIQTFKNVVTSDSRLPRFSLILKSQNISHKSKNICRYMPSFAVAPGPGPTVIRQKPIFPIFFGSDTFALLSVNKNPLPRLKRVGTKGMSVLQTQTTIETYKKTMWGQSRRIK